MPGLDSSFCHLKFTFQREGSGIVAVFGSVCEVVCICDNAYDGDGIQSGKPHRFSLGGGVWPVRERQRKQRGQMRRANLRQQGESCRDSIPRSKTQTKGISPALSTDVNEKALWFEALTGFSKLTQANKLEGFITWGGVFLCCHMGFGDILG